MNGGQSTERANALVAEQLCCVRGDRVLFRDLSFHLEPGQAGLLTGPNGVGKSSLLRLIAGLLDPYAGSITTPDNKALCDDNLPMDVEKPLGQAMAFWAELDGVGYLTREAWLEAFDLIHLIEVPVRYFSTGQRQRAKLAQSFMSGASLLLLDEPANGIDKESVRLLGTALQEHLDRGGIILAASHIPLPIQFDLKLELQPLVETA